VRKRLRLHPLIETPETFQFSGVAGVVRLPDFEFEVRPKFLGSLVNWHEDLYRILTLSRTSDVHLEFGVAAERSTSSITELISRSLLAALRKANERGRIRTYRETERRGWDWTGDYQPDELVMPHPDGLLQREITLSSDNPFNSQLSQALKTLANEVPLFSLREQLMRESASLGEQSSRPTSRASRLPIHYRAYARAIELADLVNQSSGVDPKGGSLQSVGFLVDMVREWQGFVGWLTRGSAISLQGVRWREGLAVLREPAIELAAQRYVYPDWLITANNRALMVVDAKYKSVLIGSSISSADLYQMLAFLEATGATIGVLVYPHEMAAGQIEVFDEVHITRRSPSLRIFGMAVGLIGSSAPRAPTQLLDRFSELLRERVQAA